MSVEKTADSGNGQFPIVCLGASAGGLEALEQFLSVVPDNSGMAYIVIQHLDPTQKGMLPELLQRITRMEVVQVKDSMTVRANCVYVIPPNRSMSILKGALHLFEPMETRGMRLPIDFFLRSLADDQQERAVGVILSGMGSDGSLGIRAIKGKNGIVMVQEPATAKFDSMPRNAIDAVLVDIVAPANELPEKLLAFIKHIPIAEAGQEAVFKDQSALAKIIILLRNQTGNDFSLYKKNTVYRRIERRMSVHRIDKIAAYVNFLQENPTEVDILFKELLIGVTNFFRDVVVWDKLKETVIPAMIEHMQSGSSIRAWIPGCSTGEEAYSLAIVFKETFEKISPHGGFSLQVFATDLDNEAIETARKGCFPANIAADVSPDRLERFFNKTEDGYRINTEIREMVIFAKHNIIMHAPFTKIDIISCRNLLIYMEGELQQKILGLFHYSINPEGILLLGSAESLGVQSHLFTTLDAKLKIYQRSGSNRVPELSDFPSSFYRPPKTNIEKQIPVNLSENIETLADQLLLRQFSPPGVLVNQSGDIIYISGRTGKYLEPAVGKANLNIFAMLRDGLRTEFPGAFHKTINSKQAVVIHNLVVGVNGNTQTLNMTVQWIGKPEPLKGLIIVIFTDVQAVTDAMQLAKGGARTLSLLRQSELEKELQDKHEEMQQALEEMQTSQEELKSTNEELQSTNEELQSTNEELTTSKEEMQSMNEELQTLNAELQSKVDDFTRVNNDMKNLLNSTDIATLFLDKQLNIRRYTDQVTNIFKLIKSDIGRPFTDLVSDLIYHELAEDAREVLRTLVFIQKQIPAKDNRWFSVRIMPYRTFDDRIDGLVITFINNSDQKKLEGELHETGQMHKVLFNLSSDVILRLSTGWNILALNPEAEKYFGIRRDDAVNQNFIQRFCPELLRKKTEKDLTKLLNDAPDSKCNLEVLTAGGQTSVDEWSVNVLFNDLKKATGMILTKKAGK